MMLVEETTVPDAALPVAEFRDHLRLGSGFSDDALQDPVLGVFLRAAMAAIEARIGKILIQRAFSWTVTRWRDAVEQPLPVAPIGSIDQVVTVDPAGVEEAVQGWVLRPDAMRPVLAASGLTLPMIARHGRARIEFTAGYSNDWGGLPSDLKQAVMILAASFYENRSGDAKGGNLMPDVVSALIERYRTVRILGGARA